MHPRDFEHAAHPDLAAPDAGAVSVRWLGTAGFELRHGGVTVLIDPYLTRVGLLRFLTRPLVPDRAAVDAVVSDADAILVGHSHFDHVLDVPYIAARTGAKVYGSKSVANLMAAAGIPEAQVVTLEHYRRTTFEIGPFRVTAVPSKHSPFALGNKVPFPGEIPCTCELPVRGKHYRCGDVFSYLIEVAGRSLYHLGSANLIDDAVATPKQGVDLLLLCIAARFAVPGVVGRALRLTAPRIVLPMHYDNFFRAADKPMTLLPRTRFSLLVDDVMAFDKELTLRTLPLGGAVGLGPQGAPS